MCCCVLIQYACYHTTDGDSLICIIKKQLSNTTPARLDANRIKHIHRNCVADTRGETKVVERGEMCITCEFSAYRMIFRLWGMGLSWSSQWWQSVSQGTINGVKVSLSVDFSHNARQYLGLACLHLTAQVLSSSDHTNTSRDSTTSFNTSISYLVNPARQNFRYNVPQTHNPLLLLTQPHHSRSPTVMHFLCPAYEPHAQTPRAHCPTGIRI